MIRKLGVMRKDCNSKALPFHWPYRVAEMNQWFYHRKEEESRREVFYFSEKQSSQLQQTFPFLMSYYYYQFLSNKAFVRNEIIYVKVIVLVLCFVLLFC